VIRAAAFLAGDDKAFELIEKAPVLIVDQRIPDGKVFGPLQ
jgi:hypothetical protein